MLMIKASAFGVLRAGAKGPSGKMSANTVIAGGERVSVWPRDVGAFRDAISAGELPVRASIGNPFIPKGKTEPVPGRVEFTFVGTSTAGLTDESELLTVGEDDMPDAPVAATSAAPEPKVVAKA